MDAGAAAAAGLAALLLLPLRLDCFTEKHLRLNCVPVINLFPLESDITGMSVASYLAGYQGFLDFLERAGRCKWCPLQTSNLRFNLLIII
ncbi:hypothetical protein [Erwinia persicina]|uniref:Uncharacterized protein n=1 Tax=Erwinia persicina TaxID=55211 RepID=A0ABR9A128_9GAMM|nr:hypothetical protein [Erwinia persicina]MBD8109480.1 hypothetical protein [Erwinia persicina]MBD8212587.1 hypothetical protein [Erwinia persicina]